MLTQTTKKVLNLVRVAPLQQLLGWRAEQRHDHLHLLDVRTARKQLTSPQHLCVGARDGGDAQMSNREMKELWGGIIKVSASC